MSVLLPIPLEIYIFAADIFQSPPPPTIPQVKSIKPPKNETRIRSCFEALQRPENQQVQWTAEDPNTKCSKLHWKHEIPNSSPSCKVSPFDPHTFVDVFRGRTLIFMGDSLTSMSCINFQDILTEAGLKTNDVPHDAYHGTDPFRRRVFFGCQEFQNGIFVCCGWIAFSNSLMEREKANQNVFEFDDGILVDTLDTSDLVIWNTGIHHTRSFQGTTDDLVPLLYAVFYFHSKKKKKTKRSLPSLWWKESYAQHFKTGHWETRRERTCHDISNLPIENETGIYNQVTEPVVQRFHIPILRSYRASVPLWMAHNKSGDCTHFCARDHGPMDHDNSLLLALIQNAIQEKVLPPTKRRPENKYELQKRWLLLMAHPNKSVMSKLDVCAHPNNSERRHYWDVKKDGPIPFAMQKCLPP